MDDLLNELKDAIRLIKVGSDIALDEAIGCIERYMEGVRPDANSSPQRVAHNSDNVAPSSQQPFDCRKAFEQWKPINGYNCMSVDSIAYAGFEAGWNARKPEPVSIIDVTGVKYHED